MLNQMTAPAAEIMAKIVRIMARVLFFFSVFLSTMLRLPHLICTGVILPAVNWI